MRNGIAIISALTLALIMAPGILAQGERSTGALLPPTDVLPDVLPERVDPEVAAVQKTLPDPEPKEKKETPPTTPPERPTDTQDLFAQAPAATAAAPAGVNHHMIGDFLGISTLKFVKVPVSQSFTIFSQKIETIITIKETIFSGEGSDIEITEVTNTTNVPNTITIRGNTKNLVRVPVASRGAFKVGENESPIPQDRVIFSLNYFNNVQGLGGGSSGPRTETGTVLVNGQPTPITFFNPGSVPLATNIQRQVFGFEKTFLDGNASFECRVPFFQQFGTTFDDTRGIGDITMVLRYAPYLDREASNAISLGLAVTVPTGQSIPTALGNLHPTLYQPFVGALWTLGDFYVQGFSSLVFPDDSRDVRVAFNDLSIGYWLYRGGPDRFLNAIIPTAELHVTTPLTNRGPESLIYVPDIFVMTGGVHFGLANRSTLTLGIATPISGPRPFDTEAILQFNCRF